MRKKALLLVKVILQLIGLIIFFEIGNRLTIFLHLPIPGNLVAMILLFSCFLIGFLKVEWFEKGADFLLAVTPLFFVPSLTGLMNYGDLFFHQGYLIVGITVICGCIIFFVTGWLTELMAAKREAEK